MENLEYNRRQDQKALVPIGLKGLLVPTHGPERVVELGAMGLEWQARSACNQVDPEGFFPEKGGSTKEAKKVCVDCEVRQECLKYALDNDERFGVWGGLSERERRKLKKSAV